MGPGKGGQHYTCERRNPYRCGLVGNSYSNALKEREIQIRYVELAPHPGEGPTDKNINLREWAINVINSYSTVKLPKEAQSELLRERIDLYIKTAKEIIDQMR